MATPQKKLAALDSIFVLFLEAGYPLCSTAFSELERRKYSFILTDTCLQELQDMAEKGTRQEFAELARRLLPRLHTVYGIKTPGLSDVRSGYAEAIATSLLEKSFLDEASENLALLVAEASLHQAQFLIVLDGGLAKIDGQRLNLALVEKGANPISILDCAVVVETLKRIEE